MSVTVVTGGGGGIGAAVAHRLSATAGARVVVVDRDGDAAAGVVAALPGPGLAVAADVADEAGVTAYTAAAVEAFGRVDGVVLNAGVPGMPTPLAQETAVTFDRLVAVNLRGVFLGLRAALAGFAARGGGGAIVVTASTAGLAGSALGAYSAAKHGVVALVKTAAVEGAPLGVRVNAVAPDSIATPMMLALEQELGRPLHDMTPLGRAQERYGTPAEVAAVVAFLLSADAAWVTGSTIPVDGGLLAFDPHRP